MALGIASSVMANQSFDTIKTAEAASAYGFDVVQPFINAALHDPTCRGEFINAVAGTDLGVVIHLPNLPVLTLEDLDAATYITQQLVLRGKVVRSLIHYKDKMIVGDIPLVNGVRVGIENSRTGVYDPASVTAAYDLSRAGGSFFVFDPGRIMYGSPEHPYMEIEVFILEYINRLDPRRDIIHMADKTSWTKKFREAACALGHPDGISRFMLPALRSFYNQNGLIVFEHEDLGMAVNSLDAFKPEKLELHIREFRQEDLVDIKPILETWIKDRHTGEPLPEEVSEDLLDMERSIRGENDHQYIVATTLEGKVVGVMGLRKPDDVMRQAVSTSNPCELIRAYVSADLRKGSGIGKALVKELEEIALNSGYTEIVLNSGPRYQRTAWGFYDKLKGFKRAGVAIAYYGDRENSQVVLGAEYEEKTGFERGDAPVWRKVLVSV